MAILLLGTTGLLVFAEFLQQHIHNNVLLCDKIQEAGKQQTHEWLNSALLSPLSDTFFTR